MVICFLLISGRSPERILADPVLQTFKIDFNQFLKAEENLRLLLRVDH